MNLSRRDNGFVYVVLTAAIFQSINRFVYSQNSIKAYIPKWQNFTLWIIIVNFNWLLLFFCAMRGRFLCSGIHANYASISIKFNMRLFFAKRIVLSGCGQNFEGWYVRYAILLYTLYVRMYNVWQAPSTLGSSHRCSFGCVPTTIGEVVTRLPGDAISIN